ncbi:MAG: hypothetical protein ABR505_05385 [Actinomycetota bacterium]
MTEKQGNGSDLERTRTELDSAEGADDAARVELLERIHDELEKELDSDVDQESPPGR